MDEILLNKKKTEIDLQNVIINELSQLRPQAKVYRKQQNSDILFPSSVEKEMFSAKCTLEVLTKEYQKMEQSQIQKE